MAKTTIEKKYSFETEQQAKDMIQSLYVGDDYVYKKTNTLNGHCVVYLGNLEKSKAIYNEQGEVIQEAIYYEDFAVDVAYIPKDDVVEYDEDGNELSREIAVQDWEAWNEFEIMPTNAKHRFG